MPLLLRVLFFGVFLALLVAGHVYLYRRLVRDVTTSARSRRVGMGVLAALFVVLFVGPFLAVRVEGQWAQYLATVSWSWLGMSLYLTLIIAALSITRRIASASEKRRPAHPVVDESRRQFISRAIAGTAVIAAGGSGAFGAWRAFNLPAVTELAVKLPGLPKALDGFRIIQLSDVHVGSVIRNRFIDAVVDQCVGLKADALVITGDLMDGSVEALGPTVARLMKINPRYGSYFCTGNHEYYSGDVEWADALSKMGVQVLRNRHVAVGEGTHSFDMIGVDDWRAPKDGPHFYDLDKTTAGRDSTRASVLLAHQPAGFDLATAKGIGLQLSGHTHGGQMFPMTSLVKLQWPHAAGTLVSGDSTLYVSRGTGFWGPPMRIGSPPEIVRITLTA